ncbi:MAG: hypothetical protein C3F02_01385 [Parcubacteria group bacterium]|nr:MAG: hypothetical protein C3F02_01385 [Parcubacteria group bacterium]
MENGRITKIARPLKLIIFLIAKKTGRLFSGIFSLLRRIKPQEDAPIDINEQLVLQLNKKSWPSWHQLRQIGQILRRTEKIKMVIALLILVSSLAIFSWRAYARHSTLLPAQGGSYTEGLIGVPRLINPILVSTDADRDLVKLVYSGLLKYDQQGNIIPDLAKAYKINAEQTTYTFELQNNLRWHDDQPITVDDVIFTVASIKNPDFGSPFRNSFNGVTVKKINDTTVQFILTKPFAPFLSALTVGLIPEHLWYSIPAFGASLAELNTKPIGSGPYRFKSLSRDASGNIKTYTLEAYDHYHFGAPYIKELNFKFFADFSAGVTALENKNVEGLSFLPKEYKNQVRGGQTQFHNLQLPQYTAVFYNPKNNKLLEDDKLRSALALAVNKNRVLTEVLNNDGQIIDTPILPGLTGYDAAIKGPQYDPDQAKKILSDLGWTIAEGQTFRQKKNGNDLVDLAIKLTTVDQTETVKAVAIIKENWEAIGVRTDLEIVSKDKIRQNVIEPRQYEALLYGQVINTSSGPYPFWHSSQTQNPGLNLSIFSNKDIDKYLDQIRIAKAEDQKIEPLKNFQTKLIELNFAIFLYNPTYIYPTSAKLKGLDQLRFINLPADRFDNINSWYIKTKRVLAK